MKAQINEIKINPEYVKTIPGMGTEEMEALERSIGDRGIAVPLLLNARMELLDGHQRLAVAKKLGLADVPVMVLAGDSDAAEDISDVISLNIARRHLTPVQRAELALRLMEIGGPDLSLRKASEIAGVDHSVTSKVKKAKAKAETRPDVAAALDDARAGRATAQEVYDLAREGAKTPEPTHKTIEPPQGTVTGEPQDGQIVIEATGNEAMMIRDAIARVKEMGNPEASDTMAVAIMADEYLMMHPSQGFGEAEGEGFEG